MTKRIKRNNQLGSFDDYIDQSLLSWKIPGAAVAVLRGDEVLHLRGHGFRNVEQNLPVTEHTRFPIASMTKAFTTMGAGLLVEQGKLDWDQPPSLSCRLESSTMHCSHGEAGYRGAVNGESHRHDRHCLPCDFRAHRAVPCRAMLLSSRTAPPGAPSGAADFA